ncbi:hypothetical protein [Bradyrhizobium sp. Tv2a-2]|uniref:hypothetical protein n=1 Tax=Bradyrhizobium sp. Tv2a-2 TaxID=113395 RepID=UPI0004065367|nr:hypothetical protein [Bradyrhizobium sp. Tv2a-2]
MKTPVFFTDWDREQHEKLVAIEALAAGPNDVARVHEEVWDINKLRETDGKRRLSPVKSYRIGVAKIPHMTYRQTHWSLPAHDLPHNRKRKPVRKGRARP